MDINEQLKATQRKDQADAYRRAAVERRAEAKRNLDDILVALQLPKGQMIQLYKSILEMQEASARDLEVTHYCSLLTYLEDLKIGGILEYLAYMDRLIR